MAPKTSISRRRRRALSHGERAGHTYAQRTPQDAAAMLQPPTEEADDVPVVIDCHENHQACGREAACRTFENNTSICVCPHDSSMPTASLTCPHRLPVVIDCHKNRQVCGREAACRTFENNTSICVCPHDSSMPTASLTCPNRLTVPWTPNPIPNIIPPSGNLTNSTTELPKTEQVEQPRKLPNNAIIGGAICGVFVIALIIFLVWYWHRRRICASKDNRSSLSLSPMNLKKELLVPNKYIPNPQYFACGSSEVPILRRDRISFMQDIGEGCFGKVYKGQLRRSEETETVAVKVLKDSASREAEEDFMREVEIMSAFRHQNILFLIGVVLRDATDGPWMVFEYMPHGDLAEVLRANSRQLRSPTPGLPPLTKESLLWISTQIAAGMTYLSAQRFVHRDLACRNCLVGPDLIVKIADFGMSRDVYTCDYYKIGGRRLLPIRWMAPECVVYGRFTLESDVWSFGVVLWEVYSFGKQPYYGQNNDEVMKLILQNIMLIPPEDCPSYICEIMQGCWKSEAKDRLKFTDILEKLVLAHEKSSIKGSLPRPPQGPVTVRSINALDPDGYLLPAPTARCEYFQPLPPLSD